MTVFILGRECRERQESLARYCRILFHIVPNDTYFFPQQNRGEKEEALKQRAVKNPKEVKCACVV